MLSAQPIVSIVIPAYNCEDTVEEAIESCLKQTYPCIEIIVVNDGSTDSTGEILAEFRGRIRAVHKANGGLASARNEGHRIACGDYIAWMDGDDISHPDRILVQLSVLEHDPSVVLVSSDFTSFLSGDTDTEASSIASYYRSVRVLGGIRKIYPKSWELSLPAPLENRKFAVLRGHVRSHLIHGNFVHPGTVLVRKCFVDKADGFDESLRYSSDYDLIVRLSSMGDFAMVDAPLLRYRRNDKQMSVLGTKGKMSLESARVLEKIRMVDPQLYQKHRQLFHRRFAESYARAAAQIGQSDRRLAFRLLLKSFQQRVAVRDAFYAFVRIITPEHQRKTLKRLLSLE